MDIKTFVMPSCYQDSVVLMRIAAELRRLPLVDEAGLFMGTEANKAILRTNGLFTSECELAGPGDLVMCVRAATAARALEALEAGQAALRKSPTEGSPADVRPRSLESALHSLPEASLACISLPGQYAAAEARRALAKGLHVFLFSDNVPLESEVLLKREAVARGLLCMGPDCGSACLDGVRLGFMNVVPRGRVGIVASSGTGLQAVACHLAELGEGVSQAVGVGGRDLGAAVGGLMTLAAVDWLLASPDTEALIIIAKQADSAVLEALGERLAKTSKPVVFCAPQAVLPHASHAATLHEAALLAVRALGGASDAALFAPDASLWDRLAPVAGSFAEKRIVGLYTGGTLAGETREVLKRTVRHPVSWGDAEAEGHVLLDLGDDVFTVGRPHPMLDPEPRNRLLEEKADTWCRRGVLTVLLLDLVLGDGTHADPARELARSVKSARAVAQAKGGDLLVLCALIGTAADRQDRGLQRQVLEEAGVNVLSANAEAALMAAKLVECMPATRSVRTTS